MQLVDILRMHIRYHAWATERLLEAAATLSDEQLHKDFATSFGTLWKTLDHMYLADRLWLRRIQGDQGAKLNAVGPIVSVEQLRAEWSATLAIFSEKTEAITESALNEDVLYTNSAGQEYQTPFWQVILHVVNHGTDHRGQAKGLLRLIASTPPTTDLVLFYRQSL